MKNGLKNKIIVSIGLTIIGLITGIVFGSQSAQAATYTVANTNDSGSGSLRQAISAANGNAGVDVINFSISGSGPHTINAQSGLVVTDSVLIDGSDGGGSTCANSNNPAIPNIKIDFGLQDYNSFVISGQNSVIKGLSVVGIGSYGGVISNVSGVRFICNYFGLNPNGSPGNGYAGISVAGSNNIIGGPNISDRNYFFGHATNYISQDNTTFQNNYFGVDVD